MRFRINAMELHATFRLKFEDNERFMFERWVRVNKTSSVPRESGHSRKSYLWCTHRLWWKINSVVCRNIIYEDRYYKFYSECVERNASTKQKDTRCCICVYCARCQTSLFVSMAWKRPSPWQYWKSSPQANRPPVFRFLTQSRGPSLPYHSGMILLQSS